MNYKNTKVTMSLLDFDELREYQKNYNQLIREIKSFVYIDQLIIDRADIAINKNKAQKFLMQFVSEGCEMDGYIDDEIKVVWK